LIVSHLFADGFFRFESAFSKQIGGVKKFHAVVVDENIYPGVAAVVDDNAIPAGALESDRKPASGKAVAKKTSQRRFGCQSKLTANRYRRAREDSVSNADRVFRRIGVAAWLDVLPTQAAGHRNAANPQLVPFFGLFFHAGFPGFQVDVQNFSTVTFHISSLNLVVSKPFKQWTNV